jgi:uncharacterized membrane protein YagU involved in acid resistance
VNAKRAGVAGIIATFTVTVLWLVEPYLGLPKLAVGSMLSSFLAVATAYLPIWPEIGWAIHVVVGIVLALSYARWLSDRLPGSVFVRGVVFGALVFLAAQLAFMPLVGAGLFSRGDLPLLLGSLFGHVVYGVLVATIYGSGSRRLSPA